MKILILQQGIYGKRIAENVRSKAPSDWSVAIWEVPAIFEPVVEDPDNYLPDDLPHADLLLHLAESAQAAQLISAVVKKSGARGVIASVDNVAWIPSGLRNQIRRELALQEISIVFPEPLCSLNEENAGYYESNKQPYTSEVISRFARCFGRPVLDVRVDREGLITEATVKRGSPCGSTEYTARRIIGMKTVGAIPTAGLMSLAYPCLASMKLGQSEAGVDTMMHISGRVFNSALEQALALADQNTDTLVTN
ncbi:MAG TPA: DUF166 family protein [Candidatus Limnocylindrales bacterium]|nr:DUF166 family protein [Candidatus Limnocylindrales bacterium]